MSNHGGPITTEEFNEMRKRYEASAPKDATRSILFSTDVLKKLIKDAPSIRVYLGRDEKDRLTVMFKPEGTDELSAKAASVETQEAGILNRGQLCPPYCAS